MTLPAKSSSTPPPTSLTRRSARLLVVDAEPHMADLLHRTFSQAGYTVTTCATAKQALRLLTLTRREQFELVIVDLVLPDMDGFELIQRIRQHCDTPIMVLSARALPDDIVRALDQGADGYVRKPVALVELDALVQALLRRIYDYNRHAHRPPSGPGDIHLHQERRLVTIACRTVRLSAIEYRLVRLLLAQPNRPVGKSELLRQVWGCDASEPTNIVELAIARLRRKIEDNPERPTRLVTVRSVGYRLCQSTPADKRETGEPLMAGHATARGGTPLLPNAHLRHFMA